MSIKKKTGTDKATSDDMEIGEWIELLPLTKFKTINVRTKDGVVHTMYSLGALANALGRKPHTLRQWQKKGWIPKPLIRARGESRFYLKEEIKAYVWSMEKCGLGCGVGMEKSRFPVVLREEIARVSDEFNRKISENMKTIETRGKKK